MNGALSGLYLRAPVWGQNLLLTAYARLLERERYSGRFAEFCSLLARTERFSRVELEAYQDERLRALIEHAYATVPYYRRRFDELGLTPSDIRGRRDLPKLPLLTRETVRANYHELLSRAVPAGQRRSGHTSGTSGAPLRVAYDRETVWMTYAVFDRHYRWAGHRFGRGGDRVAVVRGNVIVPPAQRQPPFWRRNRCHNQLLLSSFHLSKENLPAYLDALRRFRPDVVDGYPSTLYILAKHLQNSGETFPVQAAVTSSETLYDFQRAAIEERFECRVFDYYALAERVVFSGECARHQGHHLAMEYGVAEVVDERGEPLPRGATGGLVGTGLHNRAMPLIRYATGDRTALSERPCACGRELETMQDVTTKAEDTLTLADGRLISPSVLTHPFKPLGGIEGSQIIQLEPDRLQVLIVPGTGFSDGVFPRLVSELKGRLGEGMRIEIRVVDRLERSPSGKFKWVVSRVPLGI